MLYEIYIDIIKNRVNKLTQFKQANKDAILLQAASRWVNYEPSPRKCTTAGVDSSWNKKSFQGFDLYVVDCVAVSNDNTILEKKWDYNIGLIKDDSLETKALVMEAEVANTCVDVVDLVLIDGSLLSRFVKQKPKVIQAILELVCRYENIIFISKTSDSRNQFSSCGSIAGDIYYYNHIGSSAGYSFPIVNHEYEKYISVVEIYVRLKSYTPIIKIEIPYIFTNMLNDAHIKKIIDMLSYHSVSGYPYCLKLAHQNCKISNNDMNRLVSIFGFGQETGSRDALNE